MNLEMVITIFHLLNVIVCLVIIVLSYWKKHTRILIASIIIFLLFIAQILTSDDYSSFILTLIMLLFSYHLIRQPQNEPKKNTPLQNRATISEQQVNDLISQAKEQERSRIYANLHDDVGAKLLELIYNAKEDKTKDLAKQVLQNIRQSVASTQNIQCTCEQLINEILQENTLRLKNANIHVTNKIDSNQTKTNLPTNAPVTISRIIREAVSNVIKHADAKKVDFIIKNTQKQLKISLIDNGKGFVSENTSGKGLKTIRKRAQSINAQVKWTNSTINNKEIGTTFILVYTYGN